jgi:hypothetical protein
VFVRTADGRLCDRVGDAVRCGDADPDIPILKEAKAEYAKLQ